MKLGTTDDILRDARESAARQHEAAMRQHEAAMSKAIDKAGEEMLSLVAENMRLKEINADLTATLKGAHNLLIGAAAWLEKSDQRMVAKGLREWVADTKQAILDDAK